jgi:hypothetical protein
VVPTNLETLRVNEGMLGKRYAAELTSGTALDRFDFTLNLITGGLGRRS